jgi:hypothetical protein
LSCIIIGDRGGHEFFDQRRVDLLPQRLQIRIGRDAAEPLDRCHNLRLEELFCVGARLCAGHRERSHSVAWINVTFIEDEFPVVGPPSQSIGAESGCDCDERLEGAIACDALGCGLDHYGRVSPGLECASEESCEFAAGHQWNKALKGLLLSEGVGCPGECGGADFVPRSYEIARVLNDEVLVDEAAAGGNESAVIGLQSGLDRVCRDGDAVLVGTRCKPEYLKLKMSTLVSFACANLRTDNGVEIHAFGEQSDVLQ